MGLRKKGAIKGQTHHHFSLLLLQLRSITKLVLIGTEVSCKYGFHSWISINFSRMCLTQSRYLYSIFYSCNLSYVPLLHIHKHTLSFIAPSVFLPLTNRYCCIWHVAQCFSVIKRLLCGKWMSHSTLHNVPLPCSNSIPENGYKWGEALTFIST